MIWGVHFGAGTDGKSFEASAATRFLYRHPICTYMVRDGRDDPFDDLFDELERLMDEMMDTGGMDINGAGGTGSGSPGATAPDGGDIHANVYETDDQVRVVADLPGVSQEALDLRCDGEVLTIVTEVTQQQREEHVSLPTRVDEHSASATFNNGVLEVVFDRIGDSANIQLD